MMIELAHVKFTNIQQKWNMIEVTFSCITALPCVPVEG